MFGRAGLGGDGGRSASTRRRSARSATSSTRSSAGRGRRARGAATRRPASDLRYDLRITFEEAVLGTEKEIEFPVLGRCETCGGNGAKPGTAADDLPAMRRPRRDPDDPPDDARPDGQRHGLPALPGRGQDRREPCQTCHGEGRTERRRTLRVTIPPGIDEGHQIRLSNEGEVGAARRPGGLASTSRSTSRRTRRSAARAPSSSTRRTSRSSRRRSGRRSRCRRSTATRRSRSRPGTQPGTEIRLRGRGVPHLRRTGSKGDLHVFVNVVVPAKLSKKPARAARASTRRRRGEAVVAPTPGMPRARSATRLAERGSARRRGRQRTAATTGAGAWLELSVEADVEAVEAVSRDPRPGRARAATSVEPAFELVDEGLGARLDPTRPVDRPGLRAGAATRPPPSGPPPRSATALGHLQAFGLRPIGDADDARRPRGRLGRGVEGALPGPAGRPPDRDQADLAAPPARARRRRPRAGPGDGVRDRAPPDDAAVPRRRSRRVADRGPASTGARSSTSAAARGSSRSPRRGSAPRRSSASTPTRSRSRPRPRTRAATGSRGGSRAREGSLPSGEPPFDVVLANLIASRARRPRAASSRRSSGPAARSLASGIFVDRETDVARRSPAVGLRVASGRRRATGSRSRPSGAERGPRLDGSTVRATLQSDRRMPARVPAPPRDPHRRSRSSLFLPSILLPFALRDAARGDESREPARPVPPLDAGARDARRSGSGWRSPGRRSSCPRPQLLEQPWLLVALAIYAANLVLAFFVQRPNLRRLVGIRAASDDRVWLERAQRQRYVSYAMAGARRHDRLPDEHEAAAVVTAAATPARRARPAAAIANLGCKVNQSEMEARGAPASASAAIALVDGDRPADLVLVNTCTVTAEADAKSRQAVRRARRASPDAEIVVTGCSVQVGREAFAAVDPAARLVDNRGEGRAPRGARGAAAARRTARRAGRRRCRRSSGVDPGRRRRSTGSPTTGRRSSGRGPSSRSRTAARSSAPTASSRAAAAPERSLAAGGRARGRPARARGRPSRDRADRDQHRDLRRRLVGARLRAARTRAPR